jgi:hypothetical protein
MFEKDDDVWIDQLVLPYCITLSTFQTSRRLNPKKSDKKTTNNGLNYPQIAQIT